MGLWFFITFEFNGFKDIKYDIVVSVTMCIVFVTEIDVRGLSHSFLIGSSRNLQKLRKEIKSQVRSNFCQIGPFTYELLLAFEYFPNIFPYFP